MRKHLKYFRYVCLHKLYVLLAGFQLAPAIPFWYRIALFWRLIIHDWSKFTPAEWGPYVNYFYGDTIRGTSEWHYAAEAFDKAWNHHQKVNDHHWNYWILVTDEDDPRMRVLEMPVIALFELICDWIGAGRALGKLDVGDYYKAQRNRILMHPSTQAWLEIYLDLIGYNIE